MQLQDKVALVTGAGSGIGQASALALTREGARIAVLELSREEIDETIQKIESVGGEAVGIHADVSKPDEMEKAYRQVMDRWNRLDIVFANAGINGVWAPLEELSPEEWQETLSINLTGTFHTVKYAVPHLKERGGSIIITASVNGTRNFSNTGATAYSSSKAGQVAFAKMVAVELGQYGIRTNVICPGAIDTDIEENTERRHLDEVEIPVDFPEGHNPLTGMAPGSSEQVAQLVLFLATDASSHVNGSEIWVDGGESLVKG